MYTGAVRGIDFDNSHGNKWRMADLAFDVGLSFTVADLPGGVFGCCVVALATANASARGSGGGSGGSGGSGGGGGLCVHGVDGGG